MFVKNSAPPTNKNPRFLLANNNPDEVCKFSFLVLYHDMNATAPVNSIKLIMETAFIYKLKGVSSY